MGLYRMDTSKLRLGECWRVGGFLLLFSRLLGLNLGGDKPVGVDYDTLEVVAPEDFPAKVYEAFLPRLGEIEKLGLQHALTFRFPSDVQHDAYASIFTDEKRRTGLELIFSRVQHEVVVAASCETLLKNGEIWIDTTTKRTLDKPPEQIARYHSGLSLSELWKAHLKRLDGQAIETLPVEQTELLAMMVEQGQRWLQWGRNRGFLVPTSATLDEDNKW